mmetsp:Transcript_40144/g.90973  ORF Transcript_40144/g.90973 Transcript_40144/m.90973 type:complete len:117 (-) Transcript_40144:195-545(-)
MSRGSSLVEVRPYRFEGDWPDRYFRHLTSLEQAVHYYQISSGSPELSVPTPPADVSVWDARDHGVHLPWASLLDVLRAIVAVNSSRKEYTNLLWRRGPVWVSQLRGGKAKGRPKAH